MFLEERAMKDFIKVFLLIPGAIMFYVTLAIIARLDPFFVAMSSILIAVTIIAGGRWLLHKRWTHRLPKDREREHRAEYKNLRHHHH